MMRALLVLIGMLCAAPAIGQKVFSALPQSAGWEATTHVAGNCFVEHDGRLHMLYYSDKGQLNPAAVGLAVQDANGRFRRAVEGPVLKAGASGEWDAGGVSVYPGCVVQRKDGTYWLYYSGIAKGATDFYWQRQGAIGLAFSKDLVTWEKHKGNPILVADAALEWESEGVFEPSVIFTGDEYGGKGAFHMYYGGNNPSGHMAIGYAESHDGVKWVKHGGNPVLAPGGEQAFDAHTVEVHHAVHLSGYFLLLYEATARKFPSRFSIGLACSRNGTDFTRTGRVLHEGGPVGSWDAMGAYHPSLVWAAGEYYLYYVGLNHRHDHAIGRIRLGSNPALMCRP